jgi:hypothetical protein
MGDPFLAFKGVSLEIEDGCVELLSNLTPPQLLGLQLRVNQRLDSFINNLPLQVQFVICFSSGTLK